MMGPNQGPFMKIFLVSLLVVSPLFAQSTRCTVNGTVTDSSQAAVPDAAVKAVNQDTQVPYTSVTNAAGNYVIPQLPEGRYKVSVTKQGFKLSATSDVQLVLGQTFTLNVTLEVGEVTQSVNVGTNTAAVETTTSENATNVNAQMVIDLPLAVSGNMRNPESFVFLTPGVTGNASNTQIEGSQSRSKEILFDGIGTANPESGGILFSYPSVEALSEFQLLGSNFNAEYGHTGGGFEIFTTKSGTNEFHGAAFDYLRNNVFDARGFFSPVTPVNRQNEYGVAFGGPVLIPKLYNGRNRTFFHFVYSGFRYRQTAANTLISVPPLAFRQGDFSSLVNSAGKQVVIYDPNTNAVVNGTNTRTPFPNNQIPPSRFSAVSQKIVPLLPSPTNGNLLNNFLASGLTSVNRDQVDFKFDQVFSDRNRLNVFFYEGQYPTTSPAELPGAASAALLSGYNSYWVRVGHDFVLSPNQVNHIGLGFTREGQYWHSLNANEDWPSQIGLTGVNNGYGNSFPVVNFSDGYYALGNVANAKNVGTQVNEVYQLTDSFSWVKGSHAIKFGADWRWSQTNGADFFNGEGTFNFSTLETGLPGSTAVTGNSFASFLLGQVDSASRNVLAYVPSNRYHYLGFYIQDDWKVTRKLTLNYGLRYEIYSPRHEGNNNLASFSPTLPNPGAGNILGAIEYLGTGTGRSGLSSFANTDYLNFGPRVGLAYAINDKSVIHSGFGIYYSAGNANTDLRESQSYNYGFSASPAYTSSNAGFTPAFNWNSGFPTNFPAPPVISPTVANGSNVLTMYPGDGRPPYFMNWNFDFQRELPGKFLVDVAYVGVKGTRLGTNLINLNQVNPAYLSLGSLLTQSVTSPAAQAAGIAIPYPGFTGTVAQALRPYPQYLNIQDLANPNGNSTYNALQMKAQERFSHGLTVIVAYTWSKNISDGEVAAGGGPSGENFYNRTIEKGISTDDVPQALAISYVYELPFGPGRHFLNKTGIVGKLAGGWTFTGIQQYQSGVPVALSATNTLPIFNSAQRPNLVQGQPLENNLSNFDPNNPASDHYINLAAFTVPGVYTFGSAARAYANLRAPMTLNENFGLIKKTAITERVSLTFRAEFFNVFNRVVFGAPNANVSASNFGTISSQGNTPRQGQVALRLEF
jgi:Carboxypeptidase regulatory-like domain